MARFGDFDTVREIFNTGLGAVWVARRASGGSGEDRYAVKVYQPPDYMMDAQEIAEGAAAFLEAAEVQRQLGGSGSGLWATILESGPCDGGAWYATDFYERSAEKLVLHRRDLEREELQRVIDGVVAGLLELRFSLNRPHGNLKTTNILVSGKGALSSARIVLTDLLAASRVKSDSDARKDLHDLGDLIHQLVLHRPMRLPSGWPVQPGQEWQRLGKIGEQWLGVVNKLLDPTGKVYKLEDIAEEIPGGVSKQNLERFRSGSAPTPLPTKSDPGGFSPSKSRPPEEPTRPEPTPRTPVSEPPRRAPEPSRPPPPPPPPPEPVHRPPTRAPEAEPIAEPAPQPVVERPRTQTDIRSKAPEEPPPRSQPEYAEAERAPSPPGKKPPIMLYAGIGVAAIAVVAGVVVFGMGGDKGKTKLNGGSGAEFPSASDEKTRSDLIASFSQAIEAAGPKFTAWGASTDAKGRDQALSVGRAAAARLKELNELDLKTTTADAFKAIVASAGGDLASLQSLAMPTSTAGTSPPPPPPPPVVDTKYSEALARRIATVASSGDAAIAAARAKAKGWSDAGETARAAELNTTADELAKSLTRLKGATPDKFPESDVKSAADAYDGMLKSVGAVPEPPSAAQLAQLKQAASDARTSAAAARTKASGWQAGNDKAKSDELTRFAVELDTLAGRLEKPDYSKGVPADLKTSTDRVAALGKSITDYLVYTPANPFDAARPLATNALAAADTAIGAAGKYPDQADDATALKSARDQLDALNKQAAVFRFDPANPGAAQAPAKELSDAATALSAQAQKVVSATQAIERGQAPADPRPSWAPALKETTDALASLTSAIQLQPPQRNQAEVDKLRTDTDALVQTARAAMAKHAQLQIVRGNSKAIAAADAEVKAAIAAVRTSESNLRTRYAASDPKPAGPAPAVIAAVQKEADGIVAGLDSGYLLSDRDAPGGEISPRADSLLARPDLDAMRKAVPSVEVVATRIPAIRAIVGLQSPQALRQALQDAGSKGLVAEAVHAWSRLTVRPDAFAPNAQEAPAAAQAYTNVRSAIAKISDAARRTAVEQRAADEAKKLWSALAGKVDWKDSASVTAVLAARAPLGGDAATLPALSRFNATLFEFKSDMTRLGANAQDAAVRQRIDAFLASVEAMDAATKGRADVKSILDALRALGQATASTGGGNAATLGPGSKGWRGAEAGGVVTFTSPDGSATISFAPVTANGVTSYLSTTEISFQQFVTIVGTNWPLVMPNMPASDFDNSVDRKGPRVWRPADRDKTSIELGEEPIDAAGKRNNSSRGWLRNTVAMQGKETYPAGLTVNPPSGATAINFVSPAAAAMVASLVGSRLPTSAEWRAAYAAEGGAVPADANLRDSTWAAVHANIVAVSTSAPNSQFDWPDGGIFLPPGLTRLVGKSAVPSVDTTDNYVWISEVTSGPGSRFKNLIGNVAEIVAENPSSIEGKTFATAPEARTAASAAQPKIIGASALSPSELVATQAYDVSAGAVGVGWSDVGFRLAFSGGSGGAPAPAQGPLAARAAPVISGLAFIAP